MVFTRMRALCTNEKGEMMAGQIRKSTHSSDDKKGIIDHVTPRRDSLLRVLFYSSTVECRFLQVLAFSSESTHLIVYDNETIPSLSIITLEEKNSTPSLQMIVIKLRFSRTIKG